MVIQRLRLRFGCSATRKVRLTIARGAVRTTAVPTSNTPPKCVRPCSVLFSNDVTVFAKTIIYLFLAEKKNPFHSGFFFLILPLGGVPVRGRWALKKFQIFQILGKPTPSLRAIRLRQGYGGTSPSAGGELEYVLA